MTLKPNKDLRLSAEQLRAWPYWLYGYNGTDGCDWRSCPTDKGMAGIPDIAEEATPLTEAQAASWGLTVRHR